MLGINDRWIAKNGVVISSRPGHTHFATLEYLLKSNVNLVVGHPKVKPISFPSTRNLQNFFWNINLSLLPDTSKIVEIPLNSSYKIEVLYLKKHDYINEIIEKLNLTTHEVFR
jgi:hypothetical protein